MKTGTEALEGKPKEKQEGKSSEKSPAKKTPAKKSASKKDGKKLKGMHTEVNEDGTFSHTHEYEGKDGMPDHRQPRYTSASLEDLHDHMDQHFGGGDPDESDGADAGDASQPAAAGAPAGAGAPPAAAAGGEEEE